MTADEYVVEELQKLKKENEELVEKLAQAGMELLIEKKYNSALKQAVSKLNLEDKDFYISCWVSNTSGDYNFVKEILADFIKKKEAKVEVKEDEKCILDLPVGYELEIEVDGYKYPIVLAHKTDDLYIWNFKECYKEMKCFGDNNKYDTSSIKKWLNEELYNMLPEEVKKEIIECDGLGKVWLMSEYNVFGTSKFSNNNETILGNTHFDYFKNWRNRVKTILHSENYGDQEGWWYWLRSPRADSTYYVVRVYGSGYENNGSANDSSGVAPCFATKHILNLADVVRANSRERNGSYE